MYAQRAVGVAGVRKPAARDGLGLVVLAGGPVYAERKPDRRVQAGEGVGAAGAGCGGVGGVGGAFLNDLRGVRLGDQIGDGMRAVMRAVR